MVDLCVSIWYWSEGEVFNVDTEYVVIFCIINYYEIDVIFKLINCMFCTVFVFVMTWGL
jgi:hypothetical protein